MLSKEDQAMFDRLRAEEEAEDREIDAKIEAMSAEQLAAASERYPTDRGSWQRNPYLD